MSGLPKGWAQVLLGEVCTTQLGRMLSARRETGLSSKPYLRNRDVQWGRINVSDLPVMDFGTRDAEKFLLRPGDVLVCEGGEVGRAAIWSGQLAECYYQKALHRVRPSANLLPEFLVYILEYYAKTRKLEAYISGSTIAHLPQEDLRELPVPLPSVLEQKRIVATIDEQFSRLDAGIAALLGAARNLKRIRAAVLQEAVTGRLVPPDHRAPSLESELQSHEVSPSNQNLPENWVTTTIGNLANVTSGATPLRSNKEYWNDGSIPWVTSTLVNDETISAAREYITPLALEEASVKLIPPGALLVAMYGEGKTRGRCSELLIEATTNQACAAIVLDERWQFVKPFLKLILMASYDANRRLSSGGVQPNLSVGVIKRLTVPLPPRSEQARICEEVASRRSQIDQIETAIKDSLMRARHLRAATLSAAFSGKLT